MKTIFLFSVVFSLLLYPCKKTSTQQNILGTWVQAATYADNPAYNSTPLSTGINETLTLSNNGTYSISQNGTITNSGTYKLTTVKGSNGQNVSSVSYSNNRVTDSVNYYTLTNNNDSLIFSHNLIGTVGSGSKHYGRQ